MIEKCEKFDCSYRNLNGFCTLSCCTNHETENIEEENVIKFPHTIGSITFYSKKDLCDWIINQEKMRADSDYGRGNYC